MGLVNAAKKPAIAKGDDIQKPGRAELADH
jgi:hypothetical protein